MVVSGRISQSQARAWPNLISNHVRAVPCSSVRDMIVREICVRFTLGGLNCTVRIMIITKEEKEDAEAPAKCWNLESTGVHRFIVVGGKSAFHLYISTTYISSS